MEVSAALRRIKRQFGDEYNVIVTDQDIYDWIHDSELDIIRATSDNDLTLPIPCTRFPLQIPDKVNIKRLSISGKAITNVALSQIDMMSTSATFTGGITYWYYQGNMVYLWPYPESTDTTIIDVTYARTPNQMTVVAPYLNFITNPASLQVASVPTDDDWKLSTAVNFSIEMSIDSVSKSFLVLNCGNDQNAATNHFFFGFQIIPTPGFYFSVSDGSQLSSHTLNFIKPVVAGEIFKFRITFDPATDTAYLYRTDLNTGQEVFQISSTHSRVFNKNITSPADLHIGNRDNTTIPTTPPTMKIYSLELRNDYNVDPLKPPAVFLFDGMNDLGNLFAPTTTFTTSTNHTMTTLGNIVVPASNEFTVPEVFHEDVVKYCLARAHTKNQNFRAAEAEMEQYDRRVSTRRNEAQAPETALYKLPDPDDYSDYVG